MPAEGTHRQTTCHLQRATGDCVARPRTVHRHSRAHRIRSSFPRSLVADERIDKSEQVVVVQLAVVLCPGYDDVVVWIQ
jgi:hypothetical protein